MAQDRRRTKLFTLAEANRTLPLVRSIVEDIVRIHGAVLEARGQVEELAEQGKSGAAKEAHGRMEELVDELTDFIGELESLGCQVKDPGQGLIDFPARLEGRTVLLCWKRGEAEIRFWHEVAAGFAGRRSVQAGFA